MTVKEPLRILIIREDQNRPISGGVIISFNVHDWRSVLLTDNGFESFSLELFGVGESLCCITEINAFDMPLPTYSIP